MGTYENNIQLENVGKGIITISVIHLIDCFLSLLSLFTLLSSYNNISKRIKTGSILTEFNIIISIIILSIFALSLILILAEKALGVYLYYLFFIFIFVVKILFIGVKFSTIASLILPILMGIFIFDKSHLFWYKRQA